MGKSFAHRPENSMGGYHGGHITASQRTLMSNAVELDIPYSKNITLVDHPRHTSQAQPSGQGLVWPLSKPQDVSHIQVSPRGFIDKAKDINMLGSFMYRRRLEKICLVVMPIHVQDKIRNCQNFTHYFHTFFLDDMKAS